jgi:RNA polymerase sigma-70 factor (ECF subfamily)
MRSKDEARFADLYERHRSKVWLYCRRRVGADRADDAMADVFLAVWRHLDDSPPAPEALPWLYRISHLTVSNHWRSAGRWRRLDAKVSTVRVAPPTLIVDQIVVREEVREVVALLDRLKPSDAEILKLAAWEHLTTDQIASVLDVSTDAAKQRLSRARKRLTDLHETKNRTAIDSTPAARKEVSGEH